QAEDGIRDRNVTGVQTCALPIFLMRFLRSGFLVKTDVACARRHDRFDQEATTEESHENRKLRDVAAGRRHDRARCSLGRADIRQIGRASCRERAEIWEVEGWLDE